MKTGKLILLILLSVGLTSALADDRDDGFSSKWANKWDKHSEQELKNLGLISKINTQIATALISNIPSIAALHSTNPAIVWRFLNSEPHNYPDSDKMIWLQYQQEYKNYSVYGGQARIELSSRSKKGPWEVIAYHYTVGNLNTSVPILLSESELLKRAEKYMRENYVLTKPPKFFKDDPNSEPKAQSLSFHWKVEHDYEKEESTWHLAAVTNGNYWIEMEDHFPLPMGLWIDAHSGEVLEEFIKSRQKTSTFRWRMNGG